MNVRLMICLVVWVAVVGSVDAAEIVYRHYTIDDGLPHSNVFRVFQDSKGFIWLGTESGLCRFDGNRFETFDYYPPVQDKQILSIMEAHDSTIWINTYDGRLHTYKDGEFAEFVPERGWIPQCIIGLNNGNNNEMFALTHLAFMKIDIQEKGISVHTLDEYFTNYKSAHPNIYFAQMSSTGKLLLGTDYGLIVVDGDSAKHIHKDKINFPVYCIAELGKDHFVLGSDSKLVEVLADSISYHQYNDKKIHKIQHIEPDRYGNLWISGEGSDLIRVSNDSYENYTDHIGELTSQINDLLVDNIGNIWASTFGGGVVQIMFQHNQPIFTQKVQKGKYVHSICQASDSSIMLGCYDGVIQVKRLPQDNAGQIKTIKKYFTGATVDAVCTSQDSSFLVSKHPNVLSRILPDGTTTTVGEFIERYDRPNEHKSTVVKKHQDSIYDATKEYYLLGNPLSIYSSNDSTVLCAFWYGLYKLTGDEFGRHSGLPELISRRSYCFETDYDNRLWVGTDTGVFVRSNDRTLHFTKEDGLPSNQIRAILCTPDSSVWVATDGGVGRYREHFWTNYTEKTGLSHKMCTSLAMDKLDNLWVGTKKGLNCITDSGIFLVNRKRGLISDEVLSLWNDYSGLLWVGTAAGATVVNPMQYYRPDSKPPPTYITRIETQSDTLLSARTVTLPYDSPAIRIEFVGLEFEFPEGVEFEYKLVNADSEWRQTKQWFKEYTNLSPGNYSFHVRSKLGDTGWSTESAGFDLIIIPPLWQQTWFQVSGVILGMFLSSMVVLVTTKRKRKKEQEKEALLQSIAELQQQALNLTINPHFLFNALTSVQHFFNSDQNISRANIYLSKFSKLVRMILDDSQYEKISLDDELNRLGLYFELEKMRLGKHFEWYLEVDVVHDLEEIDIPVMMIQPYVENAIWHGIQPLNGKGEVRVKIWNQSDDVLRIRVSDNGLGITNSQAQKSADANKHESRGMKITKQRIDLHVKTGKGKIQVELSEYDPQNRQRPGTLVDITVSI